MTLRLRDCAPPPHDLVHVLQLENALVTQCTGHGPWLHACVSAECAHAWPPFTGAVRLRVRAWEPAAHDVVHVDQPPHWLSTQLTGQAAELQARVSALCGHATPPSVGWAVTRVRVCEPVPHDVVHADQVAQALVTQSLAHGAVLQARVSAECGHAAPPKVGSVLARARFCEPVPHDVVHADQPPHWLSKQLVAQAAVLHT